MDPEEKKEQVNKISAEGTMNNLDGANWNV